MNGNGTYLWPDDKRYEGEFVQGNREGKGTMYCPNGEKYEGYWQKGLKHGRGVIRYCTGKQRTGEWTKGEVSRWYDTEKFAIDNRFFKVPEGPDEVPSRPQTGRLFSS